MKTMSVFSPQRRRATRFMRLTIQAERDPRIPHSVA
jgi:hypothetical protein